MGTRGRLGLCHCREGLDPPKKRAGRQFRHRPLGYRLADDRRLLRDGCWWRAQAESNGCNKDLTLHGTTLRCWTRLRVWLVLLSLLPPRPRIQRVIEPVED